MDALVTDAGARSGLTGVRELGRAGVRVLALGPRRTTAGRLSRHAAGRAPSPDASTDRSGLTARVAQLSEEHGSLVAYPGREPAIDAVLDAAEASAAVILPYPGRAPLERLRDKPTVAARAEAAGLRAPLTLAQGSAAELALDPPPTPSIVKPAGPGELDSARVARSEEDLRSLLATLPPNDPLLVQELVQGQLVGVALVLDRAGAPVARFQQVAQRTWPSEAGGASAAESVTADERLVERGTALLRDAGYWGLAQLQFLDSARGPVLIDVNPRFYGTQPLALACGLNLSAAWHAVATGAPLPRQRDYRIGVRYRRLSADLAAAYRGAPRALLRRTAPPRAGAVWAADDPLPSAVLAAEAVLVPLGRRLPGRRRRRRAEGR